MISDAAGNLTQDGTGTLTHTYQWDGEGHLASVDVGGSAVCGNGATVCYTYNALGQRVQGVYSGSAYPGTFEWLFDPNGEELSECDGGYDSGGRCWYSSWVRLGGRSIADYWPTNLTAFPHPDNLGSSTMTTVWDGTVATDMRYYPFGQIWQNAGRGMWDVHFAGMQYPETNFGPWLMPTDFRKYHPTLGRWLSPDPLAGDITNPQSLNRYAYVMNNPTSLVDPLGLCSIGVPPCHPVYDPATCDGIACGSGAWGDPFFALDYLITGEGFYGGGNGDTADWNGGNFNATVFDNYDGWGGSGNGNDQSLTATLTNLAKKIGNYIPVVCGGGVFNYYGGQGGNLVSVGVSAIHQADFNLGSNGTTGTYSEGSFAEISAGQMLQGGYGQATMTNGSKENFFFGGVGKKISVVGASASLFVAGSSPGINLEASAFNIKGGVGAYLNISSATSCYAIP